MRQMQRRKQRQNVTPLQKRFKAPETAGWRGQASWGALRPRSGWGDPTEKDFVSQGLLRFDP